MARDPKKPFNDASGDTGPVRRVKTKRVPVRKTPVGAGPKGKTRSKAAAAFSKTRKTRTRAKPKDTRGPLDKKLFRAAEKNDLDAIRACLKGGADVNAQDLQGKTALHAAAKKNHVEAAALLVAANGYKPNLPGQKPSALHEAALRWHLDMVKLLVDSGADINKPGSYMGTPLIAAIAGPSNKKLTMETLQHQHDTVKWMLGAGADPAARSTATYPHMRYSGVERAHATFNEARYRKLRKQQKQDGKPLVEDMLAMLEANVSPEAYAGVLCAAAEQGDIKKMTALLVDRKVPVDAVGPDGYTALHAAIHRGDSNAEAVKFLLKAGADPNIKDARNKDTAMHAVVTSIAPDLAKILLDAHASLRYLNRSGRTPYQYAKYHTGIYRASQKRRQIVDNIETAMENRKDRAIQRRKQAEWDKECAAFQEKLHRLRKRPSAKLPKLG